MRELTKIHEEVRRTTLSEAADYYGAHTPKGEFVLVVEGAQQREAADEQMSLEQAADFARELVESGHRPSEAAKQAARLSGYKKAEIYRLLID